ncbi:MAG: helix-turn-helix domain-containing protein [Candidatus Heimdallarchaeota archaeon]|nr:helix-turn-helix domain-containing protein [Candidatus Heimdallarchaeota archaeon]MCK4768799.1 helix-turn-helix domain-containing protein [Candidatus Heimdallarchaeota archaeon]
MSQRENQGDDAALGGEVYQDFTKHRPLSERDALIIEMYDEGLSTYEIAEILEINRHTASKVLKENEIQTRTIADYHKLKHHDIVHLFKQGKTKHEIAKELSITYYTVRKVLEDKGLVLNKKDRETLAIARYIQMKNRGYENDAIAIFLDMTEKQLNRLIRNSGVNVSTVRHKSRNIDVLPDIVLQCLKGMTLSKISMKYKVDLVLVKEILYEFGLCTRKK